MSSLIIHNIINLIKVLSKDELYGIKLCINNHIYSLLPTTDNKWKVYNGSEFDDDEYLKTIFIDELIKDAYIKNISLLKYDSSSDRINSMILFEE